MKVDKFIFPTDIKILDMEENREVPIIMGRPYLAIGHVLIYAHQGELTLKVGDK